LLEQNVLIVEEIWCTLVVVNCLFVPSLSSYHEKAMVALYFGRIRTRLGVFHFRVFLLFL